MGTHTFKLRRVIAAAAVTGALTLAGCTVSSTSDAGTDPKPVPSATQPSPSAGAATETDDDKAADTETCEAIGDVMTIQFNVEVAVREGRMGTQERDGWYRLATRDIQRIPVRNASLVSQKMAAIQATIRDTNPGALTRPLVGTDEWGIATVELSSLCKAAGAELILQGFTGG